MPPFTARNVAKFVVKTIVAQKAADITEDAMVNHTRFDEDDLIVNIGSKTVGWYISDKLQPYTDKIVDKTADYVATKRNKKKDDES